MFWIAIDRNSEINVILFFYLLFGINLACISYHRVSNFFSPFLKGIRLFSLFFKNVFHLHLLEKMAGFSVFLHYKIVITLEVRITKNRYIKKVLKVTPFDGRFFSESCTFGEVE